MDFLDGVRRFVEGELVFQEGDEESSSDKSDESPTVHEPPKSHSDVIEPLVNERGYKIIPKIEVSHLHTERDGTQMTSTLWITNASNEVIRIDSVWVANQKQVFNRELRAHEGHEFLIYKGPVQASEAYHQARIVYRQLQNGDLFQEEYFVEYNREPDGVYTLEEFHQTGPTRDI